MCSPALSTEELSGDIEYKIFSSTDSASYEMYEDEGDGYGYEKGEYKLTLLTKESVLK